MSWFGKALFTRVTSFVEALINMICELKLLHTFKKLCENSMVIRHSVEKLSEKDSVSCAVIKYIVVRYMA